MSARDLYIDNTFQVNKVSLTTFIHCFDFCFEIILMHLVLLHLVLNTALAQEFVGWSILFEVAIYKCNFYFIFFFAPMDIAITWGGVLIKEYFNNRIIDYYLMMHPVNLTIKHYVSRKCQNILKYKKINK